MKLYEMRQAPNPRRVRMFLAEKSISIETIEKNIQAGEHLTPEFLTINPRGLLPTLVLDDGTVLDESIAICRYFEAVQPEPNLMGRTSLEIAFIEQWQRRIEFEGLSAIADVFRNTAPHFVNRALTGSKPDAQQIPALVERGTTQTQHFFKNLNTHLGTSSFIVAERFTVADITALVAVDFARWVKLSPLADHEHIKRWHDMISARPSAKA